jgi:hypothetical protein
LICATPEEYIKKTVFIAENIQEIKRRFDHLSCSSLNAEGFLAPLAKDADQ